MIKRAICFLMTFIMVFGLIPVSSLAEEEFISYPVELKTKDSDFIRNCKLEVKFSDSGIAMAKFDDLCDLLDLESRVVSDLYYVCRKKGLVTGTEPENPVGDEEDRVLNRYQLVFLDGAKNAVQLNCIFGSQGIPLIESPMKINGSLYVPLASFVRLNNGYVRVDNNKIILTQPHETVTDILGWEENRSLWGKYFFDPIECIKEKSEFLGKNPAKVVYIWDGIYEAFHDIFDAIFTLNFSGLDEIYSGDYAISYGEVMAQTICSKTSDELVGIEEKKEFGKLSIDAMQAFTDMVAESSGDVIKDLEFRSEYIFSEMLNKNIAMESGFDQIGKLADRIGKQRSEQAFYKALSSKALMRSAGAAFCIFSSYCSITNELDRISNYDIDAMSRYIRISQNKNTEIEAVKVRKGLEDKVEWLSSMRYSTFSDKLTDAVVNELESLAWDDIGNNVSMAVSMFPKGKALSGGLTYKAIGLLWDLADVVIDNTFGDLGKAKIAINLCMLIDSVKQTYLKDDSSGQDKYDNRLALIYVYLKSCYASRDLILDESYAKFKRHCPGCKNILAYNDVKCSKCGKCDKETDYHNEDSGYYNFFADDLAVEEKLGALLGKLTTTTDMGTDQKLIDGLKPFDSYFSKKLSEVDTNVTDALIPDEAVMWNGHYYMLIDRSMTWSDAKAFCEKSGGFLATINSDAEQKFISDLLEKGSKNLYWVGYFKEDSEWLWVDGEESTCYRTWDSNGTDYSSDKNADVCEIYAKPNNGFEIGDWKNTYEKGGSQSFYELKNTGFICEWSSEYYELWMDFIDIKGWRNYDFWEDFLEEQKEWNENWCDNEIEYRIVDIDNDSIPELILSIINIFIFQPDYEVTVWKLNGRAEINLIEWKIQDNSQTEIVKNFEHAPAVGSVGYSNRFNAVVFSTRGFGGGEYSAIYYTIDDGYLIHKYYLYVASQFEEYEDTSYFKDCITGNEKKLSRAEASEYLREDNISMVSLKLHDYTD